MGEGAVLAAPRRLHPANFLIDSLSRSFLEIEKSEEELPRPFSYWSFIELLLEIGKSEEDFKFSREKIIVP